MNSNRNEMKNGEIMKKMWKKMKNNEKMTSK